MYEVAHFLTLSSFFSCTLSLSFFFLIFSFALSQGITCFDFNFDANLLVTGSPDHGVRFWDPYVPTSPVSMRMEHLSPVLDVLIHKDMKLVYSFSRDLVG